MKRIAFTFIFMFLLGLCLGSSAQAQVAQDEFQEQIQDKLIAPEKEDDNLVLAQKAFEKNLLLVALGYEEKPYHFGSNGGKKGFDCSAFIQTVFRHLGIELPRTARAQSKDPRFTDVEITERQSGDLVFFKNTYKRGVSHVGIMISPDYVVHASSKDRKIVIDRLVEGHYLYKKIHSVKRWRLPFLGRDRDESEEE